MLSYHHQSLPVRGISISSTRGGAASVFLASPGGLPDMHVIPANRTRRCVLGSPQAQFAVGHAFPFLHRNQHPACSARARHRHHPIFTSSSHTTTINHRQRRRRQRQPIGTPSHNGSRILPVSGRSSPRSAEGDQQAHHQDEEHARQDIRILTLQICFDRFQSRLYTFRSSEETSQLTREQRPFLLIFFLLSLSVRCGRSEHQRSVFG